MSTVISGRESFDVAAHDCLDHVEYSRILIDRLNGLADGSATALRAPWGRGKTDVLGRVRRGCHQRQHDPSFRFRHVVCLNPWQFGRADLLSPLVIELLRLVPQSRRTGADALWKAAKTVIAGGLTIGTKATAAVVGGPLLVAAAEHTEALTHGLAEAVEAQDRPDVPDPDPVAAMAERFRELVNAVLTSTECSEGSSILICIDDLDRCLPHQQVAMLEALHFLKIPNVRAVFLAAIDPAALRSSVAAHYKATDFDADGYIEKIFDLTQDMPYLRQQQVHAIAERYFETRLKLCDREQTLSEWLSESWPGHGPDLWRDSMLTDCCPQLATPRILDRALRRLQMLALLQPDLKGFGISEHWKRVTLVVWLTAIQKFPEIRWGAFHQVLRLSSAADAKVHHLESRSVTRRSRDTEAPPPDLPQYVVQSFSKYPALDGYWAYINRVVHENYPFPTWNEVFRYIGSLDEVFTKHGL